MNFRRHLTGFTDLKAIGLLVLLLAVFFWRALFLGEDLTGMNALYNDSLYRSAKPAAESYSPLGDQSPITCFYPWNIFNAESFRSGALPLWNPYSASGAPMLANWQSAPFFPLKAIIYLFPGLRSFNLFCIACLLLAGGSAYALARELGVGRWGAAFSAVTYTFCGYSITGMMFFSHNVTASCFPLLLLGTERMMAGRRFTPYFAAIVALVILSGHPESAALTLIASALYALGRGLRPLRQRIVPLAVGYAAGFLLAAVSFLPFLEYLAHSVSNRVSFGATYAPFHPWREVVSLLAPSLYDGNGYHIYMGVAGLGLAALWVWGRSRDLSLLLVLAAGVVLVFRPFPISAMGRMPPFSFYDSLYAIPLIALPVGLMGGMVLEGRGRKGWGRGDRLLAAGGGLLCLVGAVFAGAVLLYGIPVPPAAAHLAVPAVLCAALGAAAFLPRRGLPAALLVLQIADLFINGWGLPAARPPFPFPRTGAIAFLEGDRSLFRVMGLYGTNLMPDTSILDHFQDIRVWEPMRVARYLRFVEAADPEGFYTLTNRPRSPFWDLLGVKYVIQAKATVGLLHNLYPEIVSAKLAVLPPLYPYAPIRDPDLPLVYSDRYVDIYRNVRAFPRAFIVHRAVAVATAGEALSALSQSPPDFSTTAIVESPDGAPAVSPLRGKVPPSSAEVVEYGPHRVRVRARLSAPGILVLADTYYPGWRVLVDGQAGRIYPADYALRGVPLTGGDHDVVFEYRSPVVAAGVWCSLVTLCALAVVIVSGRPRTSSRPRARRRAP